jgi:O-antigen/teichoic acid export membrane protein
VLPILLVFMPQVIRLLVGSGYLGAVDAARIAVVAGMVQFLVGWSKSFAVTAGRPQLRIWTHGIESLVLLPLAAVLGARWGAAGAAGALLASTVVFALSWAILLRRIKRNPDPPARHAQGGVTAREARV